MGWLRHLVAQLLWSRQAQALEAARTALMPSRSPPPCSCRVGALAFSAGRGCRCTVCAPVSPAQASTAAPRAPCPAGAVRGQGVGVACICCPCSPSLLTDSTTSCYAIARDVLRLDERGERPPPPLRRSAARAEAGRVCNTSDADAPGSPTFSQPNSQLENASAHTCMAGMTHQQGAEGLDALLDGEAFAKQPRGPHLHLSTLTGRVARALQRRWRSSTPCPSPARLPPGGCLGSKQGRGTGGCVLGP